MIWIESALEKSGFRNHTLGMHIPWRHLSTTLILSLLFAVSFLRLKEAFLFDRASEDMSPPAYQDDDADADDANSDSVEEV